MRLYRLNRIELSGLALCGLLLGMPAAAQAAPMVFTDRDAFLAAVGTVIVEDFEDTALGLLAPGVNDIGQFDIIIDVVGTRPRIRSGGTVDGTVELDAYICDVASCPGPLTMEFDFGGTAFGFAADWAGTTTGDLLTITVNGVTISFQAELGNPGTGFLGIVDPDGFSSVSFGLELPDNPTFGEVFQVDNVMIAANLPEPTHMLLLGLGVSSLAFWRRRDLA